MICREPECPNDGVWLHHPNEFHGNRFTCKDHLRRYLVDRYSVVNRVEYVGPEVEETNRLADAMLAVNKQTRKRWWRR